MSNHFFGLHAIASPLLSLNVALPISNLLPLRICSNILVEYTAVLLFIPILPLIICCKNSLMVEYDTTAVHCGTEILALLVISEINWFERKIAKF